MAAGDEQGNGDTFALEEGVGAARRRQAHFNSRQVGTGRCSGDEPGGENRCFLFGANFKKCGQRQVARRGRGQADAVVVRVEIGDTIDRPGGIEQSQVHAGDQVCCCPPVLLQMKAVPVQPLHQRSAQCRAAEDFHSMLAAVRCCGHTIGKSASGIDAYFPGRAVAHRSIFPGKIKL